ncbi:MAG: hypothetical protein ACTHMS_00060 [Jatrophihabitans sp.]|uniref:hypothetical protein n=1 Tax=Jatrophihabitans sp. TaxID=1932789 RepID=UPI003F7ED075
MGRHERHAAKESATGSVRVVTDARGRTDLRITGPFYDVPARPAAVRRRPRGTTRSALRLIGLAH